MSLLSKLDLNKHKVPKGIHEEHNEQLFSRLMLCDHYAYFVSIVVKILLTQPLPQNRSVSYSLPSIDFYVNRISTKINSKSSSQFNYLFHLQIAYFAENKSDTLKTLIKFILQHALGFSNYLFIFSLFIIKKLKWDKNEKDFLHFLKLLPEEGTVLDIGANIGVMSYYLAKDHKKRMVHAFEPIPCNFKNLERIKKRYKLKNLHINQLAIGDENGSIEMVLPVQKAVRFHGLAHVNDGSTRDSGEVFQCPVCRLDDFEPLKVADCRVTGIKMDVENYEFYVLRGATELLKKHKPVIYCELWDNENRIKSIQLLTDLGYRAMILEADQLVNFSPAKHTTQNFFFV